MMNSTKLDWSEFDWGRFQTLSIAIAKCLYPDCDFDNYLKQGQSQDGIDLLSFNKKDGSILTIQCKREQKISVSALEQIVSEFLNNEFGKKASHFIVSTSADLQTKKLQARILKFKVDLFEQNGITLECWDRHSIETRLKNLFNLVSYYFGKQQANSFCYPQLHHSRAQNLKPVINYIPRKVTEYSTADRSDDLAWHSLGKKSLRLNELFIADRLMTHHICIIADAYQGKTSYLKQTAWQLKESGLRIYPLFIEIKKFNVQPIEAMLNANYDSWTSVPYPDIVLFIDGLDEVPTDRFREAVRYINEFSLAYRPVNIVISCRRLFYNHYDVGDKLESFNTYHLFPLEGSDIDFYLNIKLGTLSEGFQKKVGRTGIAAMLYHPFYLVNLAEEFLMPPHTIPDTKLQVIESFIDKSFNQSLERQTNGSNSVKQESYRFRNLIQRFAFSLQLAGTNSFKDEEMQQLFDQQERILLQQSSLISVSNNSWNFSNALFQEHLAASLLVKMPFGKIIDYCSVGIIVKKIKTKWIQTISSVLSLLEFNDELFQQLLRFIEKDNIELIFQTEPSKYTAEFKLMVLKKFIQKLDFRPMIVYEETIGVFIGNSYICTGYLLSCLESENVDDNIKNTVCRILANTTLNKSQQDQLLEILKDEIPKTENGFYAGNLVKMLAAFRLGNESLVTWLTNRDTVNSSHDYRDSLYELIINLNLVERFYKYGIEGIPVLIKHNKHISHGGSEYNLENFLLGTESRLNLAVLLDQVNNDEWVTFLGYHGSIKKEFTSRLLEKLADVFEKDPLIILPVAKFIKQLGKKYLRDDFREIDLFLETTGSHWLVVRLLVGDIFNDSDWELGALITSECYDYVFYEFEEGNYEPQKLRNFFGGLRYKRKEELANSFYVLCLAVTEGTIEDKAESNKYLQYLEAEKQKKKNDIEYIQSVDSFKKGLIKYFDSYGKKSIPEDDLYVDWDSDVKRQWTDSHFIYRYLLRWARGGNKRIRLNECLRHLAKEEYFEDFRADEILEYPHRDESATEVMFPILENYYLSSLPTADFRNCMWIENEKFTWKIKESRLGEIFKKFGFRTPEEFLLEFIWLDNEGTRGFKSAEINKRESISQMVLNRLSDSGIEKLKQKVIQNMRDGIKLSSVLGNHIALCKDLNITSAKELIYTFLSNPKIDVTYRIDAVTIFLELGGEKNRIVEVYESHSEYDDYFFLHLTEQLTKEYPEIVTRKGKEAIESAATTEERKITIAQILSEIGDADAFIYLVDIIRSKKQAPYFAHSGRSIAKVDTEMALKELEDLSHWLLQNEFEIKGAYHNSVRSTILEWLYALAGKSEADLIMVQNYMQTAKEKLKYYYNDTRNINWFLDRMIEDFRNSDKTIKSIAETKRIIVQLTQT